MFQQKCKYILNCAYSAMLVNVHLVYLRLVEHGQSCRRVPLREDGTPSWRQSIVASGVVAEPGMATPVFLLPDQVFWL